VVAQAGSQQPTYYSYYNAAGQLQQGAQGPRSFYVRAGRAMATEPNIPQAEPEPEPGVHPEEVEAAQTEREDFGRLEWDVCGHTLRLEQRQQSGGGTGWRMWGSALVLARYLEANAEDLLQPRGLHRVRQAAEGGAGRTDGSAAVRVLDLSAGPGLLGLACAVVAAKHGLDVEVVLTEMPSSSLDQLEQNVAAANAACSAELGPAYRPASVAPFTWGEDPASSAAFVGEFDVVLVSDCLFIAVRDGIFAELRSALLGACTAPCSSYADGDSGDAGGGTQGKGSLLLFAYEERLTTEERGFLDTLSGGTDRCFTLDEVDEADMDLSSTLDDGDVASLFAEPAPVRILKMVRTTATGGQG
jgi:hypothetical protein